MKQEKWPLAAADQGHHFCHKNAIFPDFSQTLVYYAHVYTPFLHIVYHCFNN